VSVLQVPSLSVDDVVMHLPTVLLSLVHGYADCEQIVLAYMHCLKRLLNHAEIGHRRYYVTDPLTNERGSTRGMLEYECHLSLYHNVFPLSWGYEQIDKPVKPWVKADHLMQVLDIMPRFRLNLVDQNCLDKYKERSALIMERHEILSFGSIPLKILGEGTTHVSNRIFISPTHHVLFVNARSLTLEKQNLSFPYNENIKVYMREQLIRLTAERAVNEL